MYPNKERRKMQFSLRIWALLLLSLKGRANGFLLTPQNVAFRTQIAPRPFSRQTQPLPVLRLQAIPESQLLQESNDPRPPEPPSPWNPNLRNFMAGVASLGVLETAYLTINKLVGRTGDLCGTDGSCASVLTGPYSNVPFTEVPLSAVGCAAYSLVVLLAIFPVSLDDPEDSNNRIVLLCLTTAMATFSAFLMSLLVGVLHEWCPFCFASACLSWLLAASAWLGGCLPAEPYILRKSGVQAAAASSAATTLAAAVLFFSVPEDATSSYSPAAPNNNQQQTLLASSTTTETPKQQELSPPPITTTSSERAMLLSKDLQVLNAKMYGAYWCSHCYDQKQMFGKEAFQLIDYYECSKEGKNSNAPLCKEKDIPGYPTWEINGKLFPGERALEELEDIVSESGALTVDKMAAE